MKKSIFLFFLSFTILPAFSQNSNPSKNATPYYYYLLAGATGSSFGGNGDSWESILPGYQAGMGFAYDIGYPNSYVLNGEVNVTSCGSKYKGDDNGYYPSGKVALTYINVPITIQYKTAGGFYGEAGVQPGFLLSAKDKYGNSNDDYKNYTKSFDLGIPIGIGFMIVKTVGINFRYCHGLSNIAKNGSESNDTVKNRVFALRVFWIPGSK